MVTAFPARYHGTCRACHDHIEPGTQVAYVDDRLVHLECASEQLWQGDRPNLEKNDEPDVCDRCWTTKATNGTCACEDDQ